MSTSPAFLTLSYDLDLRYIYDLDHNKWITIVLLLLLTILVIQLLGTYVVQIFP